MTARDTPEWWWQHLTARDRKFYGDVCWLDEGSERLGWAEMPEPDRMKLAKRWRFMKHRGDV